MRMPAPAKPAMSSALIWLLSEPGAKVKPSPASPLPLSSIRAAWPPTRKVDSVVPSIERELVMAGRGVAGVMMKTRGAPGAGMVPWFAGIWKSTGLGPSWLMFLRTKRSEPVIGLVLSPLSAIVVTMYGGAAGETPAKGADPLPPTAAVAVIEAALGTPDTTALARIPDG